MPVPKAREIVPDVPRLLRLKQQVRTSVLGDETASSIAAFIAWKAFLLASMVEEGGDEADRVERTVAACLRHYPVQMRPPLASFVVGLKRLSGPDITPALRMEWLGQPQKIGNEVERIVRSVKRLVRELPETPDDKLWMIAPSVGEHLRHVRHVVIGHARVTTGTPLFPMIVRPFEDLVAQLAMLHHRTLNS